MKERGHACQSIARALAVALALAASGASGMTAPAGAADRCVVVNDKRLPAGSGGSAALCAAIDRAVIASGLSRSYTVRVVVGPRSLLTAEVTLSDGRILPPVTMAAMDRPIGPSTLERFGGAVANYIAEASR